MPTLPREGCELLLVAGAPREEWFSEFGAAFATLARRDDWLACLLVDCVR